MTPFGYDPRFGPLGYQPVEFLDIAPMLETSGTGVEPATGILDQSATL